MVSRSDGLEVQSVILFLYEPVVINPAGNLENTSPGCQRMAKPFKRNSGQKKGNRPSRPVWISGPET